MVASRARGAALVAMVLVIAGCAPNATAAALAEFDPDEAQEIRDSFERDGWSYSEESVLGILVMERECREIRSSMADLASGAPLDDVAAHLDDLLVEQNRLHHPNSAEYFQVVVDELRSGSPTNLQEYLDINCENVQ